jgi:hypothetical protein
MALPNSPNSISMDQVRVELSYGAIAISLNDASVRTLFEKTTAGSAISMSDGYGKSAATPVNWTYGQPGGGDEYICEWDNWGIATYVSGTQPIYWELAMFASGCGARYAIDSGNSGGTGFNGSYYIVSSNGSAGSGSYTGGTPYKAAHYELKVWNSAGEIYSGKYHVNYGSCSSNTQCIGTETCVDGCCDIDCSGDCETGYGCRAECYWSDIQNCIDNGCNCWPSACGYDCSCSGYYDTVTTYDYTTYSPQGSCI